MTFGTILREARERKGYDLAQAARRLRIRPDILRAIEEDDFARMPPRGYARNMVNAYARLVGLNPTEMTRMYLDEAYAYQVGRARDGQPTRHDAGGAPRASSSSRPTRPRERAAQRQEERPPRQNALGRTMYDDRRDYGGRAGGEGRLYGEGRTHPSRHAALPNAQYTNFYAGPKAPSPVQSKLPFVIAGAVILVVLVIVLALVFGGKGAETDADTPKVHVSGLTDPTQTEGGEGSEGAGEKEPVAPPKAVAPASAKVVYEVASGQSAYMDVYENGEIVSGGTVDGPSKQEAEVTGTWSLVTSNPSAVTVTVDGTAIEPTGDETTGVYSFDVDFAAILEQWKADHPEASADAPEPAAEGSPGGEGAAS